MPLLKTVKPEEAEGKVKEAYSFFEKMSVPVPLPMEMMSTSPDIMMLQYTGLQYYMKHPTLGFPLLAHIRMLVSVQEGYKYCEELNQGMLQMLAGLSQEELEAAKADPCHAKLEEKDRAMLKYVLMVVQDPAQSNQADVDALKGLGWTDQDIFDAVYQGVGMVAAGMMFKIFKMAE